MAVRTTLLFFVGVSLCCCGSEAGNEREERTIAFKGVTDVSMLLQIKMGRPFGAVEREVSAVVMKDATSHTVDPGPRFGTCGDYQEMMRKIVPPHIHGNAELGPGAVLEGWPETDSNRIPLQPSGTPPNRVYQGTVPESVGYADSYSLATDEPFYSGPTVYSQSTGISLMFPEGGSLFDPSKPMSVGWYGTGFSFTTAEVTTEVDGRNEGTLCVVRGGPEPTDIPTSELSRIPDGDSEVHVTVRVWRVSDFPAVSGERGFGLAQLYETVRLRR